MCLPMQETQEIQVRILGWEDTLEKEMATGSSIVGWRILWTEEPGNYNPWSPKESDMTEELSNNTGKPSGLMGSVQNRVLG